MRGSNSRETCAMLRLFNVAVDSRLRDCDLVKLRVVDLVNADRVRERVSAIQSKIKRPVQFEPIENTRISVEGWVKSPEMIVCAFMFSSSFHGRPHVSTRQFEHLVRSWKTAVRHQQSRLICFPTFPLNTFFWRRRRWRHTDRGHGMGMVRPTRVWLGVDVTSRSPPNCSARLRMFLRP